MSFFLCQKETLSLDGGCVLDLVITEEDYKNYLTKKRRQYKKRRISKTKIRLRNQWRKDLMDQLNNKMFKDQALYMREYRRLKRLKKG